MDNISPLRGSKKINDQYIKSGLGSSYIQIAKKQQDLNGLVFTGKFKPENPIFTGKIHGFRFRFSQQNQSIEDHFLDSAKYNHGQNMVFT